MESFKKDLFFQDYGVPISCQPLSDSERLFLDGFLEQHFSINELSNNCFFKNLIEKLPNKKEYKGIDTFFKSEVFFQDLVSQNDSEVLVIWSYPDDTDKFELKYLIKHWEDIWFSTSDDAVAILIPIKNTMILITHYDVVYYY